MIRVMVVEDEPPIMRIIIKLIEEFSNNFKVVATAGNGKKALEILEKETVDVIFSDIKMPIIDGIELAERVKDKFSKPIFVIISGFQDFQYARKAIQFQVFDYLLKPISRDIIENLLCKIELEVSSREKNERRQDIINEINGIVTNKQGLNSSETTYAVLLICAGAFPLIPDDSMLPARAYWSHVNIEQVVDGIILQKENCICYNGKSAAEMVVAIELKDKIRLVQIVSEIHKQLKDKNNIAITISSVTNPVSLFDIAATLKVLRTKLYMGIKLFTSQIIWDNIEISLISIDTKLMAETINSAMNSKNIQLKNSIQTTISQFVYKELTQLKLVNFFDGIINSRELNSNQADVISSTLKIDIYNAISHAVDINSLADDLTFILSSLNNGIYNNENNITLSIVNKIEEYLQINYSEIITNTVLSKKFGFVPSYISKLFRSYKGMSPSEYLTYYRIEKSKKLMMEQPELLLKEIAEKVGISDQHYFSKLFKKGTGMWPTEYRYKK